MEKYQEKKRKWGWLLYLLPVLLIINIRVAAGTGTTFERAVDGLLGLGVVVGAIFIALDFFQVIGKK